MPQICLNLIAILEMMQNLKYFFILNVTTSFASSESQMRLFMGVM